MDKIRAFIEEQFLIEYDDSFPEDTNLFKEGVMDSFGYVQLCRFLEQEYGFRFSEAEMTGNVLVSLTQIRDFVARKTASSAAAPTASTND
ncbi:MAG: acyl carrier protein [Oceanibaculum nanhaiense]|jgi:D-alanine--poly(phosphoribitol) ligase subunit 2|uniref:acyl carrier protein n=1 Tax=Oceanibaculum nanhaiense TaxID=1909734 RepID=UPI0032EE4E18